MIVIEARNVQEAFRLGMTLIHDKATKRSSRAGEVLVIDGPVTTLYNRPTERVLFYPERDANPFFHFMEGLWMLGGRNDVEWISRFNSNIDQFSDDGVTFHGAYGYRWLNHFSGINQLSKVAEILRENKYDRRCVVNMWDPEIDLGRVGKDVPCNVAIMFAVSQTNHLDMTVCCRSNDIIWGAYGANAVHFSMLQEVMAAWIGSAVGRYWQISNNYHAYLDVFEKHKSVVGLPNWRQTFMYEDPNLVCPFPMVNKPIETWFSDLNMFLDEGPVLGLRDRFFRKVACPIWNSWFAWKNTEREKAERSQAAIEDLQSCKAADWKLACEEWILRRTT